MGQMLMPFRTGGLAKRPSPPSAVPLLDYIQSITICSSNSVINGKYLSQSTQAPLPQHYCAQRCVPSLRDRFMPMYRIKQKCKIFFRKAVVWASIRVHKHANETTAKNTFKAEKNSYAHSNKLCQPAQYDMMR